MRTSVAGLVAGSAASLPAPPQAAAEYVAIVAQSAATRAQILMGQASRWVGDHPALVWGGVALFVLLLWGTRSRAR